MHSPGAGDSVSAFFGRQTVGNVDGKFGSIIAKLCFIISLVDDL